LLKHRIVSGVLILAALALVIFFLPAIGGCLLLVAISALAQVEFYSMASMTALPVFRIVGVLCGTALISGTFFSIGPGAEDMAAAYKWEHFVLLLTLIVVFVRQFPQKHNDQPLSTIGCTLLGVWYVPYLFNFFTRLAFSWEDHGLLGRVGETGRAMVLYLVLVVKSTDMGAYFVGRFIGRHKLFPRISPAKTWEGFFGGIGAALLTSVGLFAALGGRLGTVRMGLTDAVVLGLLLAMVGTVGDMFESLLKRASGAKDSGTVIPGMGGILDVLDSLLFGAPVLYVYARFFLQ